MKRTITLPDNLEAQLEQYLKEHPSESISSIVQEALEVKLAPKNLSKLLTLAGIVTESPQNAADNADNAEDSPAIIFEC